MRFGFCMQVVDRVCCHGVRSSELARPALPALAKRSSVLSVLGIRDEQIHPQALRQKLGDELSLDAVPRGIERRCKRAQSAFSRRHGDDPSAYSALSRQTDVEKPIA